jgi:hypothetical protein
VLLIHGRLEQDYQLVIFGNIMFRACKRFIRHFRKARLNAEFDRVFVRVFRVFRGQSFSQTCEVLFFILIRIGIAGFPLLDFDGHS